MKKLDIKSLLDEIDSDTIGLYLEDPNPTIRRVGQSWCRGLVNKLNQTLSKKKIDYKLANKRFAQKIEKTVLVVGIRPTISNKNIWRYPVSRVTLENQFINLFENRFESHKFSLLLQDGSDVDYRCFETQDTLPVDHEKHISQIIEGYGQHYHTGIVCLGFGIQAVFRYIIVEDLVYLSDYYDRDKVDE